MNSSAPANAVPKKSGWLKKRTVIIQISLAVFLNACSWLLLATKIPWTDSPVFLHYNIYFGIDLTGSWWQLFMIPGSGLLIILLNSSVIFLAKKWDDVVKILSLAVTLIFQLMVLLASILVVMLNI